MADLFDIDEAAYVNDLAKRIKAYQDAYYNGAGVISDAEFDALWDELKARDPQNPLLQRVGADSGAFAKRAHIMREARKKRRIPNSFWHGRKTTATTNIWSSTSWTVRRSSCSTCTAS